MWNNLAEFITWYKDSGFPIRIPEKNAIFKTAQARALVLYREGQYQAELYLAMPNTHSPEHSHPGVENAVMVIGGEPNSTVNGEIELDTRPYLNEPNEEGLCKLYGMAGAIQYDNDTHSLITYDKGACFISLEKWRDDIEPTSVTIQWDGAPVDPKHHAELIERRA